MPDDIGLIGLGAMGRGMAGSLRRTGWRVHVCAVRADAAREFAVEGGVACALPAEVAAACEVVVGVVVDAAQTGAVLFGAGGAADETRPGSAFVMCSTVDPDRSFPLPVASTTHQMFTHASSAGFRREDDAAMIKTFAGITLPGAKTDG